jgi:hypothetical protein
MVERSKSWLRDNVMGIIIASMFSAFWFQYESNRKFDQEEKKEASREQEKACNQIRSLTMVLLADPDTDAESKAVLREYMRIDTRGNNLN